MPDSPDADEIRIRKEKVADSKIPRYTYGRDLGKNIFVRIVGKFLNNYLYF